MQKRIEFPGEQREVSTGASIAFPAVVDGVTIRCMVSHEALMRSYGTVPGQSLDTFKRNRLFIEEVARTLINRGKAVDGELYLQARDFFAA